MPPTEAQKAPQATGTATAAPIAIAIAIAVAAGVAIAISTAAVIAIDTTAAIAGGGADAIEVALEIAMAYCHSVCYMLRPLLPSRTTTRVHWRLRLLMMLAMVWAVGRIATELPIAVFGQLLLPVAHASRNCQVAVASSPSACCRSPCHYDCVGDCTRYCSCCCSEPCCCCDGNAGDCGRACCG